MNDLIPITIFIACLAATFALIRLCDRLRPTSTSQSPASNRSETHR